jgi:thiamine biosynthesis lipoprotein ApbE
VGVSPDLFAVLERYDFWRTRTGGALNAAAEAAAGLWRKCALEGRLPSPAERAETARAARELHWRLDGTQRTATHLSRAALALHAVGKPYIADRAAAAALAQPGVSGVVVNIGGDLVVRGALAEPVRIADPLADAENDPPASALLVSDLAVATSGNYRRGYEIAGRRYSHIVDPRTAAPVDHVLSATVAAPRAADAGALATAFSVLPIAESSRLAARLPDVDFLIIGKDGRRMASAGWSAPELSSAQPAAASASWNGGFELTIALEVPRFVEIPYYRPYVAVWIEDKDRALVRTIALWYDQAFWLHELRAWNRAYQARPAAEKQQLASISSATRPAGKYSFRWDGKDSQGRLVQAGAYTVCIEAVRQAAEYELIRQPMDFARTPREVQLAGRLEIASVTLRYRKANGR